MGEPCVLGQAEHRLFAVVSDYVLRIGQNVSLSCIQAPAVARHDLRTVEHSCEFSRLAQVAPSCYLHESNVHVCFECFESFAPLGCISPLMRRSTTCVASSCHQNFSRLTLRQAVRLRYLPRRMCVNPRRTGRSMVFWTVWLGSALTSWRWARSMVWMASSTKRAKSVTLL